MLFEKILRGAVLLSLCLPTVASLFSTWEHWVPRPKLPRMSGIAATILLVELVLLTWLLLYGLGGEPFMEPFFLFRMPAVTAIQMAGGVILVLASMLHAWSYSVLGHNWASSKHTYTRQKLVVHGPYRWIRHPMYASYLVLVLGVFLTTRSVTLGFLSLVVAAFYAAKIPAEEKSMRQRFTQHYCEYVKRTGGLFPRFRRA